MWNNHRDKQRLAKSKRNAQNSSRLRQLGPQVYTFPTPSSSRLLIWERPRIWISKTASSQKKRKLAPFSPNGKLGVNHSQTPPALSVNTHSPTSSSPVRNSESQESSPNVDDHTRSTSPPRFFPPHLHAEFQDGPTPNAAFAKIRIDRANSVEMSGSESGANASDDSRLAGQSRTGKTISARSASPAKRSATEMEDSSATSGPGQARRGSSALVHDDQAIKSDVSMSEGTTVPSQDTTMASFTTSVSVGDHSMATAPSTQRDDPPPYQSNDDLQPVRAQKEPYTTEQIDEQVAHVRRLLEKQPDEGERGVVISKKWLDRVLSRASDGLQSSDYAKDAREGPIGPVDNSDIVVDGAYDNPLPDSESHPFIPLRPGLTETTDFLIIPYDAYGYVIGAYGYKQKDPIVRYAHNTVEGVNPNMGYELFPPLITICKVPQPKDSDQESNAKPPSFLENLRLEKLRAERGQSSPDDTVKLIVSRYDRFQKFLRRCKEAAGVPAATKVKLWRLQDPTEVQSDEKVETEVQTSSESAEGTPNQSLTSRGKKLVIEPAQFKNMEIGRDIEAIDARDETNNDKYNGKSTLSIVGITTNQTIILEEQIGGPAGGEFQSDNNRTSKLAIKKPIVPSKPASTTASGRTSPAPGIITRGRARKGGRPRGLNGLQNLGNTCYMNSALQCIRSIEELTIYFLLNRFKKEINTNNPLGYNGAMANAYSTVVRGLWDGSGSFSPTAFKRQLGNVNYQFSGYGQQDSQEFLSTLVDAMHEDLNRILVKPYQPYPDSDDNTVHDPQAIIELGKLYRKIFVDRNDSIAMDLFLGFYKNTIECPECHKVSITFDPYTLLTLQLPIEDNFSHRVTFFPLNGPPKNHDIDMDKNSTIKAVKESIASKYPGVDADRLWLVEEYSHKVFKVYDNSTTLSEANIGVNDYIFIYELADKPTNVGVPKKPTFTSTKKVDDSVPPDGMESSQADCMAVPILHRMTRSGGYGAKTPDFVLHPMYISLTREEAKNYDLILKKILLTVSKLTTRPFLYEKADGESTEASVVEVDGEDLKQSASEDSAGVSDHSGEDGYVNVSVQQITQSSSTAAAETSTAPLDQTAVPEGFLNDDYIIPKGLREHLFDVKVGRSNENMHCASMAGVNNNTVRTMLEQVKQPNRRGSTQSLASGTSASSSTQESSEQANDEDDAGGQDEPDIVIGGSSPQSSSPVDDSDNGEAAQSTIMEPSPIVPRGGGRRRGNKNFRRGKNGRIISNPRYVKQDKARPAQQSRTPDHAPVSPNKPPANDNQYYVTIGDAIVLDWHPDAFDGLFGGSGSGSDELRGSRTTDDNCKNVEVFHDAALQARKERRRIRSRDGVTLSACFEETSKSEVLSEENAWYCNRCKEKRRATKQLQIWTLPDILVVHLKRFSNRTLRGKIDVLVDYPIEGLDLNDQIGLKEDDKDYTYDLFAVDNHSGSLGGGHYTAFAKNFEDGEWYDYNDSMCHKISNLDRLKTAQAYLLFYRRRSDKPLGPPYLQQLVNEYRNPSTSDGTDESETGEDRLGGHSLHGSSSDSAAAGVGARTLLGAPKDGNGGLVGAQAGSSPIMKPRTTTSDDDADWRKQPITPFRSFGNQGEPTWGFSAADDPQDSGDADSTTAAHDNDSALGDSGSFFEDSLEQAAGTPNDMDFDEPDAIQYEDVSMVNDNSLRQDDDGEVADIVVSDSADDDDHDHMKLA